MAGRLYHFILGHGHQMSYIYPEKSIDAASYAGYVYATYYIFFNSLIPLSFIVEVEIIKMSYSKMIENDLKMHYYVDDAEKREIKHEISRV
jgi:hypothetical protein